MNVQIALSPKLDITSTDFKRTWEKSEKHRAIARVQLEAYASSFDPLFADQILLDFIIDLTVGAMGGLIVELIKELLDQQGSKKRVKTKEILRPDGTYIFIVEQVEE